MWITIIIWFLIGIVTSIMYVIDSYRNKSGLSLKDLFSIFGWLTICPILWLTFGLTKLAEFIEEHKEDSIIKFK
jgi:hypothetical protein